MVRRLVERAITYGLPVLSLIVLVAAACYVALKDGDYSCLSSITASVYRVALQSPPTHLSSEWRVLSELEAKDLLSKSNAYDCSPPIGRFIRMDGPMVDAWGRQYKIAVRQPEGGTLEIRVWSMGRDGRSGTSDDMVVPWREKAIVPR